MANERNDQQAPAFELRYGGLHVTIQRVPAWLIAVGTTAAGSVLAWLAVPRR